MLTYKPTQSNNTGLDPVNPALSVEEVQYQLAVYEFLSLPVKDRQGEEAQWQRNRVELLKLRLLEVEAEPLTEPPAGLLPALHAQRRAPEPPPPVRAKLRPEPTPEVDPWEELRKAVIAVRHETFHAI